MDSVFKLIDALIQSDDHEITDVELLKIVKKIRDNTDLLFLQRRQEALETLSSTLVENDCCLRIEEFYETKDEDDKLCDTQIYDMMVIDSVSFDEVDRKIDEIESTNHSSTYKSIDDEEPVPKKNYKK